MALAPYAGRFEAAGEAEIFVGVLPLLAEVSNWDWDAKKDVLLNPPPTFMGVGSVEKRPVFVGRRPPGVQRLEPGVDIAAGCGEWKDASSWGGERRGRGSAVENESSQVLIVGGEALTELRRGEVGLIGELSISDAGLFARRGDIGFIGACAGESSKASTGVEKFVEFLNGLVSFGVSSNAGSTGVEFELRNGDNGDVRDGDGEAGDSGRRKGDLRGGLEEDCINAMISMRQELN